MKVFPSQALGGPAFLRAVRGPLPDVPLLPTSGPSSENVEAYFEAGARLVGVGAEVVAEGFTPARVEAAARRVRDAVDRAHQGRAPLPDAQAGAPSSPGVGDPRRNVTPRAAAAPRGDVRPVATRARRWRS